MENNKIYPIDVFSVYRYGFRKWQKDFFWPFHPDWFLRLQSDVKAIFVDFINKNNNDISDIMLVKIKLHYELANILYAIKVVQELESRGKEIIYCSDESVYFKGLIEKGVPEFSFFHSVRPRKLSLSRRLLMRMATIRDILVYQAYCPTLKKREMPLISVTKYIGKTRHMSQLRGKFIRIFDAQRFFMTRKEPLSTDLINKIRDMAGNFTQQLRIIADKYSIALTSSHAQFINDVIFHQLIKTTRDYMRVRKKLKKERKIHLFTGAAGSYFVRILSQAVRREGGKVTSFWHGNSVFECLREICSSIEWSTMDENIVGIDSSIGRIHAAIEKYPTPGNNKVRFIAENSDFFPKLYSRYQGMKPPENIKEVMVLGFSYRTDFVRCDQLPDIAYLDYEMRIIEFLSKHGYKVLYKKHPDGTLKGDILKIFGEYAEIIYERFENVMDRGDAYLYPAMGSTTWNEAICTKKPIIYINNNWHDIWFTEPYELIKKRCRVVQGGFDERNRAVFNEKELLDALARKPEEPNTEFMEKFMFPKNIKQHHLS